MAGSRFGGGNRNSGRDLRRVELVSSTPMPTGSLNSSVERCLSLCTIFDLTFSALWRLIRNSGPEMGLSFGTAFRAMTPTGHGIDDEVL